MEVRAAGPGGGQDGGAGGRVAAEGGGSGGGSIRPEAGVRDAGGQGQEGESQGQR